MNRPLTLGSLFDGSGGFPLAGLLAGIVPVWSSEIEPFAIRVTEKRLPQVQHFGNISGLHGAKLPPVDIITFGSPCQDMSIAGKRTGLNGSRSSLFHEAIRIIREMRCASNGKYPRYIVWENVPGAFSSNGGEDFRCVLEAICSVKDSGIYEADTSRTLDTSDQSPAKNQGGIAVLESYALQGSMIGRSDQNGPQGGGVNKEVAFTLNATDHHAVYAASTGNFSSAFRETTPTLLARDHKDPSIVSSGYAVRRLTPQECARLQGFPDQWCSDLASENPTEEEIDRWAAIFEEYRKAVKPESRPKSRKMVQKWLQDPYRDAAEYRLWGNGICLNVAVFVLAGIVWADL